MASHYDQPQLRTARTFERNDDPTYETLAAATSRTTYRSAVSPRETNIHRSRATGLGSTIASTRICQNYYSTGGFGPGLASLAQFSGVPLRGGTGGSSSTAATAINSTRQRDKRNLASLNDKFAQYVEKVRFLEAQNRKLNLELDVLQNRSGQDSSRIREMYEIEMADARKVIDDTTRDAAGAHLTADQLRRKVDQQTARLNDVSGANEAERREIDAIQRQIAENDAQIALFRRRLDDLDDEARRYKAETQRLAAEIGRMQNEIQNELFIKASCEVEKIALEDELANLAHQHEVDLANLRSQTISSDLDPSRFFRNELAQSIQEIRNDYENAIDDRRNDLQRRYQTVVNETVLLSQSSPTNLLRHNQKTEQMRAELLQTKNNNAHLAARNKEIQNSLAELQRKINELQEADAQAKAKYERDVDEARRHLSDVERHYGEVFDYKTWLEKEIETYRRNLDGPNGLREFVDRVMQNAQQQANERATSAAYLGSPRGDGTTTARYTYRSTTSSNYTQRNSSPLGARGGDFSRNSASSGVYEAPSEPPRVSTTRGPSRDYSSFQDSTLQDATANDASLRGNFAHDYANIGSVNRGSSLRNSMETRQSGVDEERQSGEYTTISES